MKRLEKFENHRLILLLIDFFIDYIQIFCFLKSKKKLNRHFLFHFLTFNSQERNWKKMLVHSFGGQISCIVGLCGSGDLLHCTFNKANLQIKPSYTVGHAPIFPWKSKRWKLCKGSKDEGKGQDLTKCKVNHYQKHF